jgi:pteridine reductase
MKDTLAVFSGKTALITGAARRVGATLAKTLHQAGMNIVLHYRDSLEEAQKVHKELNLRRKESAILLQADLLNNSSFESLIHQAAHSWGRLDVLINNASSFYQTPVGKITELQWNNLIGTNLKAPLFLSQAAAPHLQESNGCIINITDIHADRPLKNYTVYCIAKAGLVMLTKSMARELAPEIRCNAIAPGAILWPESEDYANTQQEIISRTALKRQGSPEDIARTALFLIRDADYITGQIISVDGGRTLSN